MHIAVCVKQVPDSTEIKIDMETGTLIRAGVPSIINPYDHFALQKAIELKKAHNCKLTVISMGPPQAKSV
ncbi:MAG: electron transfer flavoprotein subunit beta, partial [Elusimicrobiales bacterium]|nr:electron transfer flavoprotein subunit beta [Elusimicrobiales bacterium]